MFVLGRLPIGLASCYKDMLLSEEAAFRPGHSLSYRMIGIETSDKTSADYTLINIQNYEKYQAIDCSGTDSETGYQSNTRPTVERHKQ